MSKSFRLFLAWLVAAAISPVLLSGMIYTLMVRAFQAGSSSVDILIDYLSGDN